MADLLDHVRLRKGVLHTLCPVRRIRCRTCVESMCTCTAVAAIDAAAPTVYVFT